MEYTAPADGTAILFERSTGRFVVTESLSEGSSFDFHPYVQGYDEVLFRMFGNASNDPGGGMATVPNNARFELYFVPVMEPAESPDMGHVSESER